MRQSEQAERAPTERLLEAAIGEIERVGLGRLTVRAVAQAAGVNVAAVNYYFRSKEALVQAALEATIRHLVQDCELPIARMATEPEAGLSELVLYLLEGGLRFPRIGKAHLHGAFIEDNYDGPFPRLFSPVLARLRDALRAAVPGLSERDAAQRVTALLSAVLFPVFFGGLFATLGALASAEQRQHYADKLVRQALSPPAP